MFFIILFFALFQCAPYCQRGKGLFIDTNNSCFTSVNYNVENCCFSCLVGSTTPGTLPSVYCGSLYDLGFTSCGSNITNNAIITACGGPSVTMSYSCICNPGTDKSQINSVISSGKSIKFNHYMIELFVIITFIFILFV